MLLVHLRHALLLPLRVPPARSVTATCMCDYAAADWDALHASAPREWLLPAEACLQKFASKKALQNLSAEACLQRPSCRNLLAEV